MARSAGLRRVCPASAADAALSRHHRADARTAAAVTQRRRALARIWPGNGRAGAEPPAGALPGRRVALDRCGGADPGAGPSRPAGREALDTVATLRPRAWP